MRFKNFQRPKPGDVLTANYLRGVVEAAEIGANPSWGSGLNMQSFTSFNIPVPEPMARAQLVQLIGNIAAGATGFGQPYYQFQGSWFTRTEYFPVTNPYSTSLSSGAVVMVIWDDVTYSWIPATATTGGGGLSLNVNIFTTSGTWTKPAGLVFAEIEVVGGGGGGGSAPPSSSSTSGAAGGGGGGGGYSYTSLAAASLSSTETVTVGAAGGGGSGSSSNNGTAGGTSSFGAHASATGGAGGQTCSLITGADNITGRALAGSGSIGSLNVDGTPALPGVVQWDGTTVWLYPGRGGSTRYGSAGTPQSGAIGSATGGVTGQGYGSGGSGALDNSSGVGGAGGNGAAGVVIVREWTSTGGGGGTTSINGQSALASDYHPTVTMANVGLSVTLPAMGTYLLWATVASIVNNPTVKDNILCRLYDTTNATQITVPTIVLESPVGGGLIDGTTTIQAIYTTASSSTVINLQAQNPAGAGATTVDSSKYTVLGYIQLN